MNESEDKKNLIKENVKIILKEYPDTRDNDMLLFLRYWNKFEKFCIETLEPNLEEDFLELTNPMNIHRLRAKIQNEDKKFLPLKWITAQKRGWNRLDWELYLGYELPKEDRKQQILDFSQGK